ncbi:hypothetical protein PP568_17255 [Mycobacteroides abscessus]|uniref:Transmembrane protein n=2 Tax=Mycobacteroides abscessus TaxID=36809 RepID=A0AB38CX00_9MYCO|nr:MULTISPECIES: hypothetical protein [Mycobacteriaceae]MBE5420805.1 hypothetical protein [Mycobacteroides abscessus]MBN7434252.1 hypothetical protein [Mycobacteroides abscessus subsp. abscessus]MBN7462009.1 hypothetical protein [Mycobacteroides abscessus subsp. abscessus]MBN7557466.1 hypothetical protein [Mycobacteroides abscessus subsp. abscessus]MDM2406960.1 hypothetical protein [Mycobacteroides abscessus]
MKETSELKRGNAIGGKGEWCVFGGIGIFLLGHLVGIKSGGVIFLYAGIGVMLLGIALMAVAAVVTWKPGLAVGAMKMAQRADRDVELGIITGYQALERKEKAVRLAVQEGMASSPAEVWYELVPADAKFEVRLDTAEHYHRVLADNLARQDAGESLKSPEPVEDYPDHDEPDEWDDYDEPVTPVVAAPEPAPAPAPPVGNLLSSLRQQQQQQQGS